MHIGSGGQTQRHDQTEKPGEVGRDSTREERDIAGSSLECSKKDAVTSVIPTLASRKNRLL